MKSVWVFGADNNTDNKTIDRSKKNSARSITDLVGFLGKYTYRVTSSQFCIKQTRPTPISEAKSIYRVPNNLEYF